MTEISCMFYVCSFHSKYDIDGCMRKKVLIDTEGKCSHFHVDLMKTTLSKAQPVSKELKLAVEKDIAKIFGWDK